VSNYEDKDGIQRNKAIGGPILRESWDNVKLCYDPNAPASGKDLPMAITTSSDGLNSKEYLPLLDAWVAAGSKGPMPDRAPYAIEQKQKPNTMDLCTWYLNQIKNGGFAKVDKSTVEKVQAPEFLAGLKGTDKAFDVLSQTLGANFLHEVRLTPVFPILYY